jgi:hypothetical protein
LYQAVIADNFFEAGAELGIFMPTGRKRKPWILCDQRRSFRTGQDITVDGGKTKLMGLHDEGRSYNTSVS